MTTKDAQILVVAAGSFEFQFVLPMVAVAEAVLPPSSLLAAIGLRSQQLTLAVCVVGGRHAVVTCLSTCDVPMDVALAIVKSFVLLAALKTLALLTVAETLVTFAVESLAWLQLLSPKQLEK